MIEDLLLWLTVELGERVLRQLEPHADIGDRLLVAAEIAESCERSPTVSPRSRPMPA